MTKEEQLKTCILNRYKSIRAFCIEIGYPYSTLDSAIKRGLDGAGVGGMIKVFDALNLDIESIAEDSLREKEKAPAPAKAEAKALSVDQMQNLLVQFGYIQPDQDLTDADARFLGCVIVAVNEWFRNR